MKVYMYCLRTRTCMCAQFISYLGGKYDRNIIICIVLVTLSNYKIITIRYVYVIIVFCVEIRRSAKLSRCPSCRAVRS